MTIGLTNSYTAIITIPTIALNARKVSETPDANFYTCPAGKKAIIKGTAFCDVLGAATVARLQANTISIIIWNASTTTPLGRTVSFECQLDAGQSLSKSQDSGTNAEMNVNAMIQEVDV